MSNVSGGTLVFITFSSAAEYLALSLVTGIQLQVEHIGNAGLWRTVIGSTAQMKVNDAEWHELNIEFGADSIFIAFHHNNCTNRTLCSTVLPVDSPPMMVYFGSTAEDLHSHEGFVGCMRDIRVNSDWLTPSWLVASWNASANVTGSCKWNNNCEPDPCTGRGSCTDLWTRAACDCRSPFWGLTCSRGIHVCIMSVLASMQHGN